MVKYLIFKEDVRDIKLLITSATTSLHYSDFYSKLIESIENINELYLLFHAEIFEAVCMSGNVGIQVDVVSHQLINLDKGSWRIALF